IGELEAVVAEPLPTGGLGIGVQFRGLLPEAVDRHAAAVAVGLGCAVDVDVATCGVAVGVGDGVAVRSVGSHIAYGRRRQRQGDPGDPPIAVVVDVGLGVDPGGALAGDDGVVGRRGGQVADEAGIAGGTVGVAEVGLLSARVDDAGQVPGAVEVQV